MRESTRQVEHHNVPAPHPTLGDHAVELAFQNNDLVDKIRAEGYIGEAAERHRRQLAAHSEVIGQLIGRTIDSDPAKDLSSEIENNPYEGVAVTLKDFRQFAQTFPVGRDSYRNMPTRSWNILHYLTQYQDPESRFYRGGPETVKTTLVYDTSKPRNETLEFGSLVAVLDDYRKTEKQHGGGPSNVLGRGFTPGIVEFLDAFVAHKKAELIASSLSE